MKRLFGKDGAEALRRLAEVRTLVALDFDGTLAPIVRERSRAAMSARTRALLAEVARLYPSAIVSGRSRADLERRLGAVPVRWLVGNHGAEGPGAARPGRAASRGARLWLRAMRGAASPFPGVEVEDKVYSLAVHYRGAAAPAEARRAVLRAARALPGARVHEGKAVVNVVSVAAPDKGMAVAALARRARAEAVLFAGDDRTDEDVFACELGVPAVTVRVGRRAGSQARYWLAGQAEVDRLLARLVALRGGAGTPGRTPPGRPRRGAARRRARVRPASGPRATRRSSSARRRPRP